MKKITFLSLTIILSLSLLLFSGCLYEEASSSDSNQENVQTIVEIGNSSTLQKELLDGGDFILTTDLETKGIDVPVGSVSSVNLGGYTLSAELREESETHYYAISNYGELTLYGDGVISGRAIRNYGTLILEGFTVFGTDGDFPVIYNEGEIYIKDVKLSNLALGNECDGQTASVINNLGKLFMENSQVSSENLYYPAIYTANNFEMKDCLVTSQTCALLVSKELAVISSSTVNSKGADSVVVKSGYLKVLSGQFSHLESSYAINVVESGSTLELDEIVLDNKINYSDANIVKRLSTVEQVQNALTAGNSVVLKEDLSLTLSGEEQYGFVLNGTTLDGHGKKITVKKEEVQNFISAILTTGGKIKNVEILSPITALVVQNIQKDLTVENSIFKGAIPLFAVGDGLGFNMSFSDCEFYGWLGYSNGFTFVSFENCYFGYGNGYQYLKPESNSLFTNCVFEEGFTFNSQLSISTLKNCYVGDTLITQENVASLLGSEASQIVVDNDLN